MKKAILFATLLCGILTAKSQFVVLFNNSATWVTQFQVTNTGPIDNPNSPGLRRNTAEVFDSGRYWKWHTRFVLDTISARPAISVGKRKLVINDTGLVGWHQDTIKTNVTRTIQTVAAAANGVQASPVNNAMVGFSVTITNAVQIGVVTNSDGYVVLEVAPTNSTTASDWQEVGRVPNAQNIGLAIALSSTQKGGGMLTGPVQAGYYYRLRSVNVAGTPTYTAHPGWEKIE